MQDKWWLNNNRMRLKRADANVVKLRREIGESRRRVGAGACLLGACRFAAFRRLRTLSCGFVCDSLFKFSARFEPRHYNAHTHAALSVHFKVTLDHPDENSIARAYARDAASEHCFV